MGDADWGEAGRRCFGMLVDGRGRGPGGDAAVLMVLNAAAGEVRFVLPGCAGGVGWRLLLDTALAEVAPGVVHEIGDGVVVAGRALMLFAISAA